MVGYSELELPSRIPGSLLREQTTVARSDSGNGSGRFGYMPRYAEASELHAPADADGMYRVPDQAIERLVGSAAIETEEPESAVRFRLASSG
ncbi:hypothetical protein D3C71_1381790 [compost metagenome]